MRQPLDRVTLAILCLADLYRNINTTGRFGPIYSKWGTGELYVEAGGEAFYCRVSDDGMVPFQNRKP